MIICPECNSEIKDIITTNQPCPTCGFPLNPEIFENTAEDKSDQKIEINTEKISPGTSELTEGVAIKRKTTSSLSFSFSQVTCGKCGFENPIDVENCSECHDYLHQYKISQENNIKKIKKNKNYIRYSFTGVGILIALLLFITNFHFVISKDGNKIIKKSRPSFSESVIDFEEFLDTPYIVSIQRFPISRRSLQNANMIETDEERNARIDRELAEERKKRELEDAKSDAEIKAKWDKVYESIDPLTNSIESNSPIDNSGSSEDQVKAVIKNWQDVKRRAFVNKDTSELTSVLTGKALTDTQGGVNWWKNNGEFHDITLHDLSFQDVSITSGTEARVKVHINETKNNSVNGNKTSDYEAVYVMNKVGEQWMISDVEVN